MHRVSYILYSKKRRGKGKRRKVGGQMSYLQTLPLIALSSQTTMSTSIDPPTFEVPSDNSNYEIWCIRAPAHLDVSEILNGVTIHVNTKLLSETSSASANNTTSSNNNTNTTLTKFKTKQGGQDYELTIGDTSEVNHLRLLLPDEESTDDDDDNNIKKLKTHNTAFQRYINLTSVTTNAQEELALAPARENAPRPAVGEMMEVNGSVPGMRLAYVPVPQKEGLKRRWAMPGSRIATKRLKVSAAAAEEGGSGSTTPNIDAAKVKVEDTPNTKSAKKKKKEKKEKKSKKSPKN